MWAKLTKLTLIVGAAGLHLSALTACANHSDNDMHALEPRIEARLAELESDLIEFRRDLHRHPELSDQEQRTAGKVADRLEKLGFETKTGVGGHGIVALLRGGHEGPTIAFRADMDAVRSTAPDPVDFPSENPGIRHICGHDIHTTIGVALAEAFAAVQEDIHGSVMLVFQPAEERATGALAMLDDNAFEDHSFDAVFSVHTSPIEVGQIGTKPGALLAGRDQITVTLSGSNLPAAGAAVSAGLTNLTSVEPGVFTVPGDFIQVQVTGSSANGNQWLVRAVATTTSDAVREKAKQDLTDFLDSIDGVEYTLDYQGKWISGVTNDVEAELASRPALERALGEENVLVLSNVPTGFSEDFGFFQELAPGAMYFLGVSNSEKGWVGMPHSPGYVADEASIVIGAKAMAAVMLDAMKNE